MPGPRDFLPQPPWKGPPVPRRIPRRIGSSHHYLEESVIKRQLAEDRDKAQQLADELKGYVSQMIPKEIGAYRSFLDYAEIGEMALRELADILDETINYLESGDPTWL